VLVAGLGVYYAWSESLWSASTTWDVVFLSAALIPAIVWIVTIAETGFGCALILGLATRWSAFSSGVLLLFFALGMTVGTGVKSALNASVFSACAAAFALVTRPAGPWTVDARRARK